MRRGRTGQRTQLPENDEAGAWCWGSTDNARTARQSQTVEIAADGERASMARARNQKEKRLSHEALTDEESDAVE
jgi:hypothetical protein